MFGGLQQAALAALSGNPEHTERLKRTYKERIDFFTGLCEKELGWSIEKPKGTFYVWAEIPNEFESSHQFSDYLLEHAHVVVTPGEIFGAGGKRYVRISMVAKQGDLREFVFCGFKSSVCPFLHYKKHPAESGMFYYMLFILPPSADTCCPVI